MVTYSPDVICGLCAGALVVCSNEVLKRQMLPQLQGLLEMLCISDVSFCSRAHIFQRVIIIALQVSDTLDCLWPVYCSYPFICE